MTNSALLDADIGFVRHQLDGLAAARYSGGMTAEDEDYYRELCDYERMLLGGENDQ